jgi:hypothetical protein
VQSIDIEEIAIFRKKFGARSPLLRDLSVAFFENRFDALGKGRRKGGLKTKPTPHDSIAMNP